MILIKVHTYSSSISYIKPLYHSIFIIKYYFTKMFKILLFTLLATLSFALHLETQRYYNNIDVQNFIDGGHIGKQEYFASLTTQPNVLKCPFYKPFTADGVTCFQCEIDLPFFNLATKRCEICTTGINGLVNHKCV